MTAAPVPFGRRTAAGPVSDGPGLLRVASRTRGSTARLAPAPPHKEGGVGGWHVKLVPDPPRTAR